MYSKYQNYLMTLDQDTISSTDFKSNTMYHSILEHVSQKYGNEYLELIKVEFAVITDEQINDYVQLNDQYGSPALKHHEYQDTSIECSPTSLRYVYHALLILNHFRATDCKNIVEVGCGYGGLCLAINYFAKIFEIQIGTYNLVDLKEPLNLIKNYTLLHSIDFNLMYHDSETFGADINNDELFFISNYCYTEINESLNKSYTDILLPKVKNGFITWQNGGNGGIYPVSDASAILNKEVELIVDERPQTDSGKGICTNYYVYF